MTKEIGKNKQEEIRNDEKQNSSETQFHILGFENDKIKYFGDFDEESGKFGDAAILSKDDGQIIIIGQLQISENQEIQFSGLATIIDQQDLSIYRGQIYNSQKSGVGHIIKFKNIESLRQTSVHGFQNPQNFIEKINKKNYKNIIKKEIDQNKIIVQKIQMKIEKYKSLLAKSQWINEFELKVNSSIKNDDNDQFLNYEKIVKQCKKQVKLSESCSLVYKGEFQLDSRQGFGFNYFGGKCNSDIYFGQYNKDMMEGRGLYIFNTQKNQNSLAYIGNFFKGMAKGQGRMIFKDGTMYSGEWIHGMMQGLNSKIVYSNGDEYEGEVVQGKKSGNSGKYIYKNSDKYVGGFLDDLKHSDNAVLYMNSKRIVYNGQFFEDKKIDSKAQIKFGESEFLIQTGVNNQQGHANYLGGIDENEELCGSDCIFEFPEQKMIYKGSMKWNNFHGEGVIEHTDSNSLFKGTFQNGYKHGNAIFLLDKNNQNGQHGVFKGYFDYNNSIVSKAYFGLRF